MEDFIKWLESNSNLIIQKLKNNKETFIDVEADVVILNKILCPSTALELAEIFEEYLNTIAVLDVYEVNLPTDIKTEVKGLCKEGLTKLIELATVEANNEGNLLLFINTVIEKQAVPMELVNYTKNMISLNFKNEETVVGSV